MRKNRRMAALITAGLLALTPCASFSMMSADAATITVNKVNGDSSAHSYKAYPIITGTLAADGQTLTAMQWNPNLSLSNLATKLTSLSLASATGLSGFTTTTTPEQFAEMVKNISDADMEKLAKVFNDTTILPTTAGTSLNAATDSDPYSATFANDGWYLVRDESATGQIKSANMLEVKGNAPAINPKFSLPTLEKKITDSNGSNPVDANTAAIGDTVYYKLTTKVPDVTGYEKYYFIVKDTLSPGLTFNADSLVVVIDGHTLTKDEDDITPSQAGTYYVNEGTDSAGNKTIEVVFEDFLNYVKNTDEVAKDDAITVSYNATLNAEANIDPSVGNPNTASLTYSNNPNYEESGTPDETPDEPTPPSGDNPSDIVGETVPDKVNTYTTAIRIKKVDQDGQPFKKGVQFTLTGDNINTVKKVSGATFVQDDDEGTYWKLTTEAYTTIDPATPGLSDAAKAKYAMDEHKYKKVDAAATTLTPESGSHSITSEVDEEGYITFYGLNVGDYTLEETAFPDGYNKAPNEDFSISIGDGADADTDPDIDENSILWANSNNHYSLVDNVFTVQITNNKGNTLPSTGGIGTKLFYLFGGMLAVGSGVVLVTKKRMSYNEK